MVYIVFFSKNHLKQIQDDPRCMVPEIFPDRARPLKGRSLYVRTRFRADPDEDVASECNLSGGESARNMVMHDMCYDARVKLLVCHFFPTYYIII